MKPYRLLLLPIMLLTLSACTHAPMRQSGVYQSAPISALMKGLYDGDVTVAELKQRGDFGIGTFNGLDGEMLGLEGVFYQMRADGTTHVADDQMKTPFAQVCFFKAEKTFDLNAKMNYVQLQKNIENLLPNKNVLCAVKVTGSFSLIRARSVPKQKTPYPIMVEAVKNQAVLEIRNVKGTLVGFWCPEYVAGLSVPEFHMHFISEDKKTGGHLLECQVENGKVEMSSSYYYEVSLPITAEFKNADLTPAKPSDYEKIEK